MTRTSKMRVAARCDTEPSEDAEAPASGRRERVFPTDREADALARLQLLVTLAVRRVARPRDDDFEDLVQTSLARVLAALGKDGVGGDYSAPWVVSVARNTAIDQLRARSRQRRVFAPVTGEDPFSTTPCPHPDLRLDARDKLRRIDVSLRRLGSAQSKVLYLHDVLGYVLSDIARALDISVAAAQSRLIRGRRAILKDLGWLEPAPGAPDESVGVAPRGAARRE
ncbi:MAG TPA: RNA polymerase sigma factor [Polyangiaceae bacterium]|nr:RNA polymerase sigma factor [Polyangiaceae bacterium]